ncbi:single-stranded DNA-binding protein [Nocardia sp. NPDC127579]|uniref:single-stranded DNA-binding protein n=1 Tax=Nocardia sp. NPDC127579 TaxID=3345402 RepID=UPI00363B8AC6
MFETTGTIIGTVATPPARRVLATGEEVVSFRVASTARRRTDLGEWIDAGTLFVTVSCWRRLVHGVDASLRRGDPVIAHGQWRAVEYRAKDGTDCRGLELRAYAVGPDLSRCSAVLTRHSGSGSGPASLMRNTCTGSSAEERARVGEHQGDATAVPRASSDRAETQPAETQPVEA